MKKTLTCLLAFLASCTLFVACDSGKKDSSTPDTSTPAESTPDESTVTDPHAEALNLAKDYVYGQLVEKDTEVRTDYTLMGSYYSFFLEEDLTVAWTVDVTEGVTLTLDEENKEWKVDVDEHLEEDLFYVLTGTISDSDGHSVSFTLERKVLKAEQVVPEKITEAPVEGTAYKLYMYQATKKTDLYFTGKMSGYFMATTNASNGDTYLNGVDVYAEKVEGKDAYYLTFTDEKDVKQYIGVTNVWSSGSFHDNAIFAASTAVADGEVKTFEFTWSSEYGTMIATLEGAKSGKDEATTETKTVSYFLGTSGSYYTFGACPVEEAADSYVGCLVKMVDKSQVSAEDKVASEKMTLNVTTAYSGAVEETLPTVGTVYGDVAISWAVKSGDATIENNVLKVAAPTADTTIVLTATFVCGEASDTLDVDINVYPKSPVTAVAEPEEGTAYALYLYQANMAKNYYFTGAMAGNLDTTDDASKAADVYAEKSGDGVKIYVLNADNSKSYITLTEYKQDGKNYYSASISLTADGSVFTYNTQFGTLCCKTENDTFFLGTYGTYTTISASRSYYMTADKIGTEQFIATFGIIDESAIVPPTEGGEDEGETTVPEYASMSITEALAAADDTKVEVSGTVSTVNQAWSDSYNNMNVTIVDAQGNELYVYRLETKVALGDIITVKGTMATYNENRQVAAGATAEITGHDSSYDYTEMTIPAALEADDGTNVIVTGTVVTIGTAYSSSYNNISVYIADDNGVQLYLYRLTGEVTVGQIIKVKGSMATYSGNRQVTGGTFELVGTHTCSVYTEVTCTKPASCVVCGTAKDDVLADHDYVEGVCSVCGAQEGVEVLTESFAIAASAGTLAADSLSISWSSENFNYVGEKANSSSAIRTSDSDHFRVYKDSNFTISGKNGEKITKVVITATSASYATALVNSLTTTGVTATANGNVVTITVDSGSVESISFTATAQFRISNIEISYTK